jgi:hypothetical protein
VSDKPAGFVALRSLKMGGAPGTEEALAVIRRIYFNTTKQTIENDLAHAIALLKSIAAEDDRDRARVYMDGLAQMRSEWMGRAGKARRSKPEQRGRRGRINRRSGEPEKQK